MCTQELVKQNKELKLAVEAEQSRSENVKEELALITTSLEAKQWDQILEINKDIDRVSGQFEN